MREIIFKDNKSQELFNKQGYLVVDLLDMHKIKSLDKKFNELNSNNIEKGMVIGSIINDSEYKTKVENAINNIVSEEINKLFKNHEIYNSSFVYKSPKTIYDFPPHQDNSMVDERKYYSINVWIPLVDIDFHNGPIYVLPGSHFTNNISYRGPNLGYDYIQHHNTVYKYAKPIFIKKGQAIILDHSLIHFSTPNFTNKTRKAIVVGIKSIHAPTYLYYYNNKNQKIQLYEIENLKYSYDKFHYDKNEIPNGNIIKEIAYSKKEHTKKELDHKFKKFLYLSSQKPDFILLYFIKNILRRKYINLLTRILR